MSEWKFVEAVYTVSSVFMVPADWDETKIGVKWNKLEYFMNDEIHTVDPVIDGSEFDFKRPSDPLEFTVDGDNYNSADFETPEFQIEK
jgi:hypothetical protein